MILRMRLLKRFKNPALWHLRRNPKRLKNRLKPEQLNSARLFLSFGHPEGFGLPVAEAMAAGCYVVGYSGGGADELFRHGLAEPVRFGDWSGYVASIEQALRAFAESPRETDLRLERQALAIHSLYSRDQEARSIEAAWERILAAFHHWQSSRAGSASSA